MNTAGPSLGESLVKLKNVYEPVPAPPFIPIDFGEASRIQHLINVALTALCNCDSLSFHVTFLVLNSF